MLVHCAEEGEEEHATYAPRAVGVSKRSYAQVNEKGFAGCFRVKRFHQSLAGPEFKEITNNKPLLCLFNTHSPVP